MASGSDVAGIVTILKELQQASKLQQQQIDQLIVAFELTNSSSSRQAGSKRNITEALGNTTSGNAIKSEPEESTDVVRDPAPEKKEHIDKMLEKPSFNELWNRLCVKMEVSSKINDLKEKDKILEILEKASERAKLVCAMNYDTLLTATLRRYVKQQTPDITSVKYVATNEFSTANKKVRYAHNVDKFTDSIADFNAALEDPCQHFINNPRKTLLSESCFSATAELEFRSKRQRLPFAICCIRKPGFLSFFVGDWAYEDKDMPNSSNVRHYTTLKLDLFIEAAELESNDWLEMCKLLEGAACPSDLDIGSVTMFMHEHRGNIVCAKVMLNKESNKQALRLYPHCSFKTTNRGLFLNFDDDGEFYLKKLKNEA